MAIFDYSGKRNENKQDNINNFYNAFLSCICNRRNRRQKDFLS